MGVRRVLRRMALRAEAALDRLFTFRRRWRPPLIEPYTGYATPETLVARGRVLTHLRRQEPKPSQRWFTNLRQMLLLFLTDEVQGVHVRARGAEAVSDEEGYFTLVLPRSDGIAGWTEVEAHIETSEERAALPVLVPGVEARLAVISDIDDTVMHTGAYSLARNLWTSLTGNALTREIFPDSVALLEALSQGGRNPVFYVSSSPWNLHHFLEAVFERAGLVPGPMFLRDLGISRAPETDRPHGGHKSAAIDTLMAANPELPFWLLGDTGQHDAEIYLDAARRYPGRVVRVVLREPGPGPDAEARAAMDELRAMGVEVTSARDFAGLAPELHRTDGGASDPDRGALDAGGAVPGAGRSGPRGTPVDIGADAPAPPRPGPDVRPRPRG